MTTKVLALTDALGNLVRFKLLPGQRSEIVGVPDLIDGLIFDADQLRQALTATWSEGCYSLKTQSEGPYPAR
ncbi:MAG: hypothetical protein GY748_26280 [Planctomycetaceae bacterium]|nr:hypothetical protein [Planctomycetaceae bacterium]